MRYLNICKRDIWILANNIKAWVSTKIKLCIPKVFCYSPTCYIHWCINQLKVWNQFINAWQLVFSKMIKDSFFWCCLFTVHGWQAAICPGKFDSKMGVRWLEKWLRHNKARAIYGHMHTCKSTYMQGFQTYAHIWHIQKETATHEYMPLSLCRIALYD